jgi:multiple sugar transport system ATP-binding protein
MRTELSKLHNRLQATMIYVTHDQVEAMTMGDRIVVMRDGVIEQVDEPITVYREPASRFVAGFIGSPPMNFLEGQLARDSDSLAFQCDGMKVRIPERMHSALHTHGAADVTFGIRPEDVSATDRSSDAILVDVEVVEPLGSEVVLYLRAGGHSIVGKVDASVHPDPGSSLPVAFDMTKCHFFDADSGRVIC